jgi:hypothetical protein
MLGPLLLASTRETSGSYAPALSMLAVILAVATLVPLALRPPGRPAAAIVPARRLAAPVAR